MTAARDAQDAKTFLVIGATGKTGRRVAARLAGTHNVRGASRSGATRFDWEDSERRDLSHCAGPGGEAVSFAEAVDLVSRATNRPTRFEPADPEEYRRAIATELPAEYVAWRTAMFDAIRTGQDAFFPTESQTLWGGRPARSPIGRRANPPAPHAHDPRVRLTAAD